MRGEESPSAQNPTSPPGARDAPPLFAVLGAPPPLPERSFRSQEGLESALVPSGGVVWVRGEHGSGKTTLVRDALRRRAEHAARGDGGRCLGVLQVECATRMRLEEVLFAIGDFLNHLGLAEFADVLGQRTTLSSKLRVLVALLRRHALWIWLDDFDRLAATSGDGPSSVLRTFVESWSALDGGAGRLVITTRGEGPDGLTAESTCARIVDVSATTVLDLDDLWRAWGGEGEPPRALTANLHALQVLLTAQGAWKDRVESSALASAGSAAELFIATRRLLSDCGRELLDLLASHARPMSLGTLRATIGEAERASLASSAVNELESLGLLVSGPRHGERLRVHPSVIDAVADELRSRELDRWKRLHRDIAAQGVQAAARARSLWGFYSAFTHLWEAEAFQQAYEAQKMFAEDFLAAGFSGLAKEIFELCVDRVESPYREIVLGNLAIIYKGEGNHDDAIRLYEQSLETFMESGDLANAARVHHQIGNTKYLKGSLQDALASYGKSLEIAERIGDHGVCLLARIQIANLQFSNGQFDDALAAYSEAIQSADASGNAVMKTALQIQIAQVHIEQGRLADGRTALDTAERLANDAEDRRSLLKIEQLRGIIEKTERDYDASIAHFRGAVRQAVALGDTVEQANTLIHIGKAESERLRFSEAIRAFESARASLETLRGSVGDTSALDSNIANVDRCIAEIEERVGPEAFQRLLARDDDDAAPGQSLTE